MTPRLLGPLTALFRERRAPPPLAGAAPPEPLFGHCRGGDAPGRDETDPAARAVELAHDLALEFSELCPEQRAQLAEPLVERLRRAERADAGAPGAVFRPALALAWGGRLFVGDEARRWTALAAGRVAGVLERNVAPDGVVTGAGVREHVEALSDALECRALLVHETDVAQADGRFERMLQAAADLRVPGRRSADAPGAAQCLAAWKRMTGRKPAARSSFALEASGLYGVRGERSLLTIDAGAPGRATALGLEWTVDGRRILVDEGVERDPGNAAASVILLDGLDRGRRVSPRVERTRLERFERRIVIAASHHGYSALRGRPVHQRRVTATAEGFSVEDHVSGGAGQAVRAQVVLHPEVEVRCRSASFVLVSGPVTVLLETRHDVEVEQGWWLGEDGEWRSTRRLVLHYPAAPCRGSFQLDRLVPRTTLTGFLRRESLSLTPGSRVSAGA